MGRNLMTSTTTMSTTQTMVTDIGILPYANTVTSTVVAPKYYLHNGRSAGAFTFFTFLFKAYRKLKSQSQRACEAFAASSLNVSATLG